MRGRILVAAAFCLTVVGSGIAAPLVASLAAPTPTTSASETKSVVIGWAHVYSDVAEMRGDSDLIMRVRILSPVGFVEVPTTFTTPDDPFYTTYAASVEQVLVGNYPSPGITIAQPGGVRNGVDSRVVDEPHFQPGEEYLLFLTSMNSTGSATWYTPVGGPQGELQVVNGLVYSRDHFVGVEGSWIRAKVEGLPVEQIEASIASRV